jgi:SpoVK/Ycf46/Vps4 family AAA+-type ATPase
MANDDRYNPLRGLGPGSFLRAAMEDLQGRSIGRMILDESSMMRPQSMEMRTFRVCACGDPRCPESPPETQEAAARGAFSDRDRERMRSMAQEFQMRGERSFNYAAEPGFTGAPPSREPETSEDEDLLEELREKVEQWIAEAPSQTFEDIIGNEEALSQLRDAIRAPVEEAELYELYGLRMPKGALLSGPPGCGKTMFAKAAASEMKRLYGEDVDMISISGSSIQAPFVGVTEGYIKDIFAYARQYKKVNGHPLLVFIDEAEVLFPDRTGRVRKVAPWEESQVATFLAEMDGMEECGAFVLLASNRPEVMDSALLRDGRCDFKIKVARPTPEALEGILRNNFAGIFSKVPVDELVFNALEAFLDPHRVLLDFHDMIQSFEDWFKARGFEVKDEAAMAKLRTIKRQRFTFEMIVNGAMAASVPMRAKRRAFSRDRAAGTKEGVIAQDVLLAVTNIFEENKGLDHSYALQEFMKGVEDELKEIGR